MAEEYSPSLADEADFDFSVEDYSPSSPLEADFNFILGVYRVLAGFSNIFTAIWADTNSGRENGKMYTLSWGPGTALSVLNLDGRTLYDQYTTSYGARVDEPLTNTDTRDLNVDTP